jgi:hypothetical protein
MPLFGRRRAERDAELEEHVSIGAVEAAQSDFTQRFKAWLGTVEQLQTESDARTFSNDLLHTVGVMPLPHFATGSPSRTQLIYLVSFARSYCETTLDHKTMEARTTEARTGQEGNDAQRANVAAYWESVQDYVMQTLG